MEIEIISQQYIKPSSPTPPSLKTHKLSLLDQFTSPMHVPVIFFYPMIDQITTSHAVSDIFSQRSQLLKQSLSEVLTRFYPFAGTIKDTLSIDCNDKGVYYLEARVNCDLVDFLSQPNLPASSHKFLPKDYTWSEPVEGDHVLMIKVTSFTCGGIAIGILFSHLIADGTAFSVFLKGWKATALKTCEAISPKFDASSIFLQKDGLPREATFGSFFINFLKLGKCVTRRIKFDASAITSLKAKATSSSVQNPTRVEVVSALLWKSCMAAFNDKSGTKRPCFTTHSTNLRGRADPPLAKSVMGNIYFTAGALCRPEEMELPKMVSKLRETKMSMNASFVESLQGDGGSLKLCEHVKGLVSVSSSASSSCGTDYIAYTCWCHFGVYDMDFGWGKPTWVSCIGSSNDSEAAFPNTIMLMDTRFGDGIEAWVSLDKEYMTMLAEDKELLAFGSFDPSPIG